MEHQTTSHSALRVALPLIDENVKIVILGFVTNIFLISLSLTKRRDLMSTSFTTDNMRLVNNIFADTITLLVMLAMQCLHRNIMNPSKVAALEDVTCLFVATSRVGLGLHMACENVAAFRFQQSRESPHFDGAWVANIAFCVREWMYRRGEYGRASICRDLIDWFNSSEHLSGVRIGAADINCVAVPRRWNHYINHCGK